MSKARKCDRCGEFYIEPVFIRVVANPKVHNAYFDLCTNCWNSYVQWFENVPPKVMSGGKLK